MTTLIVIPDTPTRVEAKIETSQVIEVTSGTHPALDVSLTGQHGSVDSAWLPVEVSFIYKLTDTDVETKSFRLPSQPVSNFYLQHINGGLPLIINRDFKITRDRVSWGGMALETVVQKDEELFIRYFI